MTDVNTVKYLALDYVPNNISQTLCGRFKYPDNMTIQQVYLVFSERNPFKTTDRLYFLDNNGDVIASDTHPCSCDVAHAPGNLKESNVVVINDTPIPLDGHTVKYIFSYIANAFSTTSDHILQKIIELKI